jgi:hypothetical protein
MYIDIVPNRGSPPAILLRESIRDGKRVRKRTIANLSALPIEQAEMISPSAWSSRTFAAFLSDGRCPCWRPGTLPLVPRP